MSKKTGTDQDSTTELLKKKLDETSSTLHTLQRKLVIEAALEKVRARSMMMLHSDELKDLVAKLYDELTSLQLDLTRVAIWIFDQDTSSVRIWIANPEGNAPVNSFFLPYNEFPNYLGVLEAWRKKDKYWEYLLIGKEKEDWGNYLFKETDFAHLPKEAFEAMMLPPQFTFHATIHNFGCLHTTVVEPLSQEQLEIFHRFGHVFDQSYTRFCDLQKAEAQTWDAQIEVALEKVRSASLSMRKTEDLFNVVRELRNQLEQLKEPGLETTVVQIYQEETDIIENWFSFRSPFYGSQENVEGIGMIPKGSCEYVRRSVEKYYSEETDYTILSDNEMLREWYQVMEDKVPDVVEHDDQGQLIVPEKLYYHFSKFQGGALQMISEDEPTDEAKHLLHRTANVFNLAYRRFLDLKKAEKLAREAQIEGALERVRAQIQGMRSSDDLIDIANALREEVGRLGQPELESFTIQLYQINAPTFEVWWAFRHPQNIAGEVTTGHSIVPVDACEYTRETLQKYWSADKEYLIESRGSKLADWYQVLEQVSPPTVDYDEHGEIIVPEVLYYYYVKFSGGTLLMISSDESTQEARELQRRAASVFDFAYHRFLDLVEAEAREKEAIKQSALDRIRAEIASMRTAEDLQRITPIIWRELTTLDVPFFRCGVFIIHLADEVVHAYLSTPQGKSLAALHLPFGSSPLVDDTVDHWRRQQVYVDTWDRSQFIAWTHFMIDQGFLEDARSYQGGESPPENLVLQYVPFNQGMLYVGTAQPLEKPQLDLVRSLAEAFAIAYARYEDFKQLEEAKFHIEATLDELKAAQSQLIQSEKMASLGELTAGIAHEIQNPLNFVNNFSEVNQELLDELQQELEAGKIEDAMAISNDIRDNEEKISHHGKRADAIVKGMLLHSRASTGERELTDINALCDEYLRLAYHGLRAKDKSFNADFKTNFDTDLALVNIIPQDIGRVLLNLINNAFYAVHEKSKSGIENYKPIIYVNTITMTDKILIKVKDNANGIPDSIQDKIFQPFFTTKPTGQGTGLGLSLSYDIVKTHGGELKVTTKEGEGSEFIIQLPIA